MKRKGNEQKYVHKTHVRSNYSLVLFMQLSTFISHTPCLPRHDGIPYVTQLTSAS